MAKAKLNSALLLKMAQKSSKQPKYLREQISRLANRKTISSSAAQLLWAREMGLGIGRPLAAAGPAVREEVQRACATVASVAVPYRKESRPSLRRRKPPATRSAIDVLLEDSELRGRCRDLLLAPKHYDRVVREATTVLDDRLKKVSGILRMAPGDLVGKALNPDPSKAIIVVSPGNDEQKGFFSICSGVMLAFRNRAHHSLSNSFTQTDALKFCGLVDALLGVIGKAAIYPERI